MSKGTMGRATLENISTSGCFATKYSTTLSMNDQLLIIIELPECDRPLELKAKVLRTDGEGFSAQFTDIEESFVTEFSTMLATEHRNGQLK
jgi:hypothetical protein